MSSAVGFSVFVMFRKSSDDATSECTFTCEPAPNRMPLRLITNTEPCAFTLPRIWLGSPDGSATRFSTAQLFAPLACAPPDWSKFSVVCRPTFMVCQVSTALWPVCLTSTVTPPRPSTDWVGRFAFCHSAEFAIAPGATCRPPIASPFGTVDGCAAAAAAAACCAAICAAMPCAARARLTIDGWLACKACCGDTPTFGIPGMPAPPAAPGAPMRAPTCPRFIIACACACVAALTATITATARHSGFSNKGRAEPREKGRAWRVTRARIA